jgi:hypothetical protein
MASQSIDAVPYAVAQRHRMIDLLLHIYGHINRAALVEVFGISVPQASIDLRDYLRRAPGNAHYDKQTKRYTRSAGFQRLYP